MPGFVTVVSGLPRSGTSLMMQMLAAGGMPLLTDGVRGPDEDNPRGYFEFEPVKTTKRDPSWLGAAEGHAVKIVYLLLRDLPPGHEYRVILMRRELREVIASQRAMLRRLGRQGAALSDERMAAVFEEELMQLSAWLASQANFAVLEIQHYECLRSAPAVAARVNAFLGGERDEARMAAAVEPALYRRSSNSAVLS